MTKKGPFALIKDPFFKSQLKNCYKNILQLVIIVFLSIFVANKNKCTTF